MGRRILSAELQCTECGTSLHRIVTSRGGALPTVIEGVCGAGNKDEADGCGQAAKLRVVGLCEP